MGRRPLPEHQLKPSSLERRRYPRKLPHRVRPTAPPAHLQFIAITTADHHVEVELSLLRFVVVDRRRAWDGPAPPPR